MSDPPALRDLLDLLAAFLDRPLGSALIVGCHDADMLLLVHALDTLDIECPADRLLLFCDPFVDPRSYADSLVDFITRVTHHPPPTFIDHTDRLHAVITQLLGDLPAGDHRLLLALAPTRIHDPDRFIAFTAPLLSGPFPEALRLVIRDDLAAPRLFTSAADSPSRTLIAHGFHIPADGLLDDAAQIARDPGQRPDARAQALLQLGLHALSHGNLDEAVAACEAAVALSEAQPVLALALALRADALRARGDLELARSSADLALQEALACKSAPVIQHAAISLGDACERLGDLELAATWFELAERAAAQNPSMQTLARERRLALAQGSPC